jgi:hypothetical protein
MNSVGKARSAFVVVLLFVWMTAPALRCLLPGEVLSPEEQACCKAMAGQCSESAVLNHPCCKKTTQTAQPALASAQVTATAIFPIAISSPILVHLQTENEFAAEWLLDPSPPPRSEQTSPVLRI